MLESAGGAGAPGPARPLVWVAAAACAGTALGPLLEGAPELERRLGPALVLLAPLAALLAAPRATPGRRRALAWAWLACVAAGAALRAAAAAPLPAPSSGADGSARAAWCGTWRPDPARADGSLGALEPEVAGRARLALEPGTLRAGERVLVLPGGAPLRHARGPFGPRGGTRGSARGAGAGPIELRPVLPDELVRLAPAERGPLGELPARLAELRARLAGRIARLADPHAAGLYTALVLGDSGRLDADETDLFVRTGTLHLLAVSGQHVVLVAALLVGPAASLIGLLARAACRLARLGRGAHFWIEDAARLALVAAYVPLCGARPPVVRAAIAFALALLARHVPARLAFGARPAGRRGARRAAHMPRRADALSLWSLALTIECLADPRGLFSASVGLSYGATLGLVLGFQPLRRALAARLPSGGRVAAVGRLGRPRAAAWRIPLQRGIDASLAAVAASLAAVLGSLPTAWSAFGELAPPGVLATPLLLVPVALAIAAGWAWALAPALVPEAALELLARLMLALLAACDRLPGTPVPLPARPGWLVAAAAAAALVALARRSRAIGRLAALLSGALLVPWRPAPAGLDLWALDVGSGTGAVLRAAGAGTWVFDAGSRDRSGVARGALLPLLAAWETGPVSIVLSHADRDHHAALGRLAERYPVRLWAGALPAHLSERLAHSVPALDAGPGRLRLPVAGRAEDVRVELWRGAEGAGNEASRTLVLDWHGRRLILSGDAEGAGLAALLRSGALDGPARLLLLPHHGSETPALGELLARARPEEVWISSSRAPPVAKELDRRGLAWRWTGRDGPLGLQLRATRSATGTERADSTP